MAKSTPDEVCKEYVAAYGAANDGKYASCDYINGWYLVYTGGSQTKYRRGVLEEMTATLLLRAALVR